MIRVILESLSWICYPLVILYKWMWEIIAPRRVSEALIREEFLIPSMTVMSGFAGMVITDLLKFGWREK